MKHIGADVTEAKFEAIQLTSKTLKMGVAEYVRRCIDQVMMDGLRHKDVTFRDQGRSRMGKKLQ